MAKGLSAGEVAAAWGDKKDTGVLQGQVVENGVPTTRIAVPEEWVGVIVAATAAQAEDQGIQKGFQMGVASEQGKKPHSLKEAADGVVSRVVRQPLIDLVASIGQPSEDGNNGWPTETEWASAPGFLGPHVESETIKTAKRVGRRLWDLGVAAVTSEIQSRWGAKKDDQHGTEQVTKKE